MKLTARDYLIMSVIDRFRYALGRHIKDLCGFQGMRATDRRLKVLCDHGYLTKQRVLYGVPSVYTLSYKAKVLLNVAKKKSHIKTARLLHDIAVLDVVSYLVQNEKILLADIKTERELFSADGFGKVKHRPDFIITAGGKTQAYEIELTLKAKERFHKNVKANYLTYDKQIWVVPKKETKIFKLLALWKTSYSNIEILPYEVFILDSKSPRLN